MLAARLATQRLTGPAASSAAQVVRELLCVQAHDARLAQAMIALRADTTVAAVQQALASGEIVRTHVLRPTWHYVAADDLQWLLELTSAKVESGMAARHRQLELSPARISAVLDLVASALAGREFRTRTELGQLLDQAGLLTPTDPQFGQQVGHLLLLAELRGLICSAPDARPEHRYALLDEVIGRVPSLERADAVLALVGRFVAGHGPVALSDLQRWARVTLTEARAALARLGEEVAPVQLDGDELWYAPKAVRPASRPAQAWLLSTFDEAFLSYRTIPWPRSAAHPAGDDPYRFAEAGGGVVLHDLADVGSWKRTRTRSGVRLTLAVDPELSAAAREAIDVAARRLIDTIETQGSVVPGS